MRRTLYNANETLQLVRQSTHPLTHPPTFNQCCASNEERGSKRSSSIIIPNIYASGRLNHRDLANPSLISSIRAGFRSLHGQNIDETSREYRDARRSFDLARYCRFSITYRRLCADCARCDLSCFGMDHNNNNDAD